MKFVITISVLAVVIVAILVVIIWRMLKRNLSTSEKVCETADASIYHLDYQFSLGQGRGERGIGLVTMAMIPYENCAVLSQ